MKKLICVKEMEEFIKTGKTKFYVTSDMIITPSAKDLAKNKSIELTTESQGCELKSNINLNLSDSDLDSEAMLKLFKAMMNKGLLQEVLKCLKGENLPYESECDVNGFKIVRGNTVKLDVFDTGNPDANAHYQELVSKEESKMSAGFLVIEKSRFDWELTYEEIDYVIEGTLTVELNGKTYTAHAGDVLFVPSGSKVVWGSPDKAKIFYATYPANWADLL
ncbi:cupin domain-containing protein [Clostridium sp.]|uniref:cupin domain-containing protein n=1 Tax=Clostridium sp. TaxID=1506 RepID=UPI00290BE13E|nr:cupin domain-containing protein [Clostridium sp.]MDU4145352.1 cupin domain-containing protein [Clostridium sp.]